MSDNRQIEQAAELILENLNAHTYAALSETLNKLAVAIEIENKDKFYQEHEVQNG